MTVFFYHILLPFFFSKALASLPWGYRTPVLNRILILPGMTLSAYMSCRHFRPFLPILRSVPTVHSSLQCVCCVICRMPLFLHMCWAAQKSPPSSPYHKFSIMYNSFLFSSTTHVPSAYIRSPVPTNCTHDFASPSFLLSPSCKLQYLHIQIP